MLQIKDLEVKIKDKIVLENFNLDILDNKIHVIMGPNGVGKSTLSKVIMGNTNYKVTKGDILFNNKSILSLETDERARLGIFLAFQNPLEIEGVTNSEFLRSAINSINEEQVSLYDFIKEMEKDFNDLKLNKEMMHRSLNTNFSGGEKKKNEILQMKMLKPKLIILDELDSGLDVDSLKIVCDNINNYLKENKVAAEAIIQALQRAKEYITQNPEKAYEALATSDNPKELYENIYPKESGFDNLDPQIKEEQAERMNSLAKFLLENGTISKDIDAKSAINNEYYEEAGKKFTK